MVAFCGICDVDRNINDIFILTEVITTDGRMT
jgi:hypothetical protein